MTQKGEETWQLARFGWLVRDRGDIGLFTLKGAAVLQQADVVVYDSLVGEGVLAKIPEHARLINVGKRANHHTMVPGGY